jgi:hypothetical protein
MGLYHYTVIAEAYRRGYSTKAIMVGAWQSGGFSSLPSGDSRLESWGPGHWAWA